MTTPQSPLDLDHATMQRLGRQVADVVAGHLASLRDQRVLTNGLPPETRRRVRGAPPDDPVAFDDILRELREDVFPYAVREPHPRFMAYVPGCPTFPAVLGDWLATGYNFFAGVWPVAEGPNAIELAVLEWFREWVGMPAGAGGLLTNGGSGATLTAIIAARHAAVGDDATRLPRLTMYASDQAHSAALRAGWIAGVPRAQVRVLPSDDDFRLRVEDVRHAIRADRAAGFIPLAVVASAGTTNTGAIDPLDELADLCAEESVWLHADAAYGGFAALTERGKQAMRGLGRCDSVALDPHKWLFVPFECGSLLVREPEKLRDAFQVLPDYLRDVAAGEDGVNFADYGEQLTRQSRALKVWLGVRYFGVRAIRAEIDRAMDMALHAERVILSKPVLEVLAPAQLGVVCFRAHPADMDDPAALDACNERINSAISVGGRFLISSTRLRGAFSLRICVLSFRTTTEDVTALIEEVVRHTAR
jgi:glutamate/tyrosine decarboxylase-like PLP-dependent enzyme